MQFISDTIHDTVQAKRSDAVGLRAAPVLVQRRAWFGADEAREAPALACLWTT